jgi:hypothetical protein
MGLSVVYSHPGRNLSLDSGSGGGEVEDIFKRMGNVEASVAGLREQVGVIAGTIPHLATAAALADVRKEVGAIAAVIPHLATAAALADLKKEVGAIAAVIPHLATASSISAMETKIIKWIIGTVLSSTGLAFTIAKLVH